jgi:hypothetical protein
VGLVYSASRLLYVLADLVLDPSPTAIHSAGTAAALIGASGIAVGVVAPRAVRVTQRWLSVVTATRRLTPLWIDLSTAYPDITLSTKQPITLHRAELRYHRRMLEVAEGLARAHVSDADATACKDVQRFAAALHANQCAWTIGAGPTAADLMPSAPSPDDERRNLLDLAGHYRQVKTSSATVTSGASA